MRHQQAELRSLVAYEIGARGEHYNPSVIMDTVRQLSDHYTDRDLAYMITDEHPEFCGISEAINLILNDTYSDSSMQC